MLTYYRFDYKQGNSYFPCYGKTASDIPSDIPDNIRNVGPPCIWEAIYYSWYEVVVYCLCTQEIDIHDMNGCQSLLGLALTENCVGGDGYKYTDSSRWKIIELLLDVGAKYNPQEVPPSWLSNQDQKLLKNYLNLE